MKRDKDEEEDIASDVQLGGTPFERFTEFTRRIVAVPKREIDRQRALYEAKRKRKTKNRYTGSKRSRKNDSSSRSVE